MARINVENEWFDDPRRMRLAVLLGDTFRADGMALNAWRLAQKYWFPKRQLIPMKAWLDAGLNQELMVVGLAQVVDGAVFVRNAPKHFNWLFGQSKKGKKSAESRRKKNGTAKPGVGISTRTAVHENVNSGSTAVEQQSTSLLLSPFSSLISPSSLENTHSVVDNSETTSENAEKKAHQGGELVAVLQNESRVNDSNEMVTRFICESWEQAQKKASQNGDLGPLEVRRREDGRWEVRNVASDNR